MDQLRTELPFKCHMLGKAAAQDVEVLPGKQPKDGKFEVIFPVLLPEEGSFDWVDLFLQQHPDFTVRTSNDRPDMQMNVPELDNLSIRRALRNFLVVELKSNLLASERKELMGRSFLIEKLAADGKAGEAARMALYVGMAEARFTINSAAAAVPEIALVMLMEVKSGLLLKADQMISGAKLKNNKVMVGDPTADFKKRTQELLLKQKQEKVNAEFEQQQEIQRAAKKARKEAAEAARQAEVERRAAAGEEPLKDEEMRPAEAGFLLQVLGLGACRDTVAEQHEKGDDNDDDPMEALWKAWDLLLFPSNEAFRDFRDEFITMRFLAPFAMLVLVQLGPKLVQKLVEPCCVQGPDDIDIEKPWSVLTEDEKQRISDEPLKWLGKRYYINFVARLLSPPLRLVFFHVVPCLLVLRCSWNEDAESAWQLFVKAVLTSLYGLYLPLSLRCFVDFGWKVLQSRDQYSGRANSGGATPSFTAKAYSTPGYMMF
ncbi:unnamed protein product [Symbiodinium sp. KB8]|nr:unnamed protein product [Symbiodinium sp. KB8]